MSLDIGGIVKKKVKVGFCSLLSDGRYLNATDSDFIEIVTEDVHFFLDKGIPESVLVFPPFSNFHRFLIHKLVEDNFKELSTFSIGELNGRRTVVCYKDKLHRKVVNSKSTCVRITSSMGVENHTNTSEDQNTQVAPKCSGRKKARTLPDVAIYRPPALRKTDEGATGCSNIEKNIKPGKPRRPDIAVYVPRPLREAKDSKKSVPSQVILKHLPAASPASDVIGAIRTQTLPPSKPNELPSSKTTAQKSNANGKSVLVASEVTSSGDSNCEASPSLTITTHLNAQNNISLHLNPDEASHDQILFTTQGPFFPSSPPTSRINCSAIYSKTDVSAMPLEDDSSHSECSCKSPSEYVESCMDSRDAESSGRCISVDTEEKSATAISSEDGKLESECQYVNVKAVVDEENLQSHNAVSLSKFADECQTEQNTNLKTVDCEESKALDKNGLSLSGSASILVEYKKEKIIDTPMDVDVSVEVNPTKTSNPSQIKGTWSKLQNSAQMQSVIPKKVSKDVHISWESEGDKNESEGNEVPLANWEDLFDLPSEDEGATVGIKVESSKKSEQCHKLLDEVATAVGKVSFVDKPRSDYSQYRTDNGHHLTELTHVVEVYGFPAEFKTHDLISVLSTYGGGNSGAPAFEIKWVDDTHALAVFASSFVAADVLQLRHPLVKTRALDSACTASKAKARKMCESLKTPFRPRPETCAALAQRLITGALGVHHRQSKAEREEERRLLREARERRRSAARDRDAAWEGTNGGLSAL